MRRAAAEKVLCCGLKALRTTGRAALVVVWPIAWASFGANMREAIVVMD